MKNLLELNLTDKKVILRADFNVTHKDGIIINDEKIRASLETINYLINKNAKVIIMSHLGKVKTLEDKKNNTLKIVYDRLKEMLNAKVYFSKDTRGKDLETIIDNLKCGEVLLMENTRYEDLDGKKESSCDLELSKYWASLGDIFVNVAFGTTHRKHASNYGISLYLESAYGFLVEKEIKNLSILLNPEKPFTVIMGGAKVDDKISLITSILERCDYLLLGGGIANTFLSINNEVGKSLISKETIDDVKVLLKKHGDKIIMPSDVVIENNNEVSIKKIEDINIEDTIYDIGEGTIKFYEDYLKNSKTIFINGTVGLYEDKRFEKGTKDLLKIASKSDAKTIIGGGDALASAHAFNIKDFYHMSTGGGATLNYIATQKLYCEEN